MRFCLLKSSFTSEESLRELRLLTRYRIKIQRMIAAEKNRLHKILDTAGIPLGTVASEISGVSSKIIINRLIKGEEIEGLITQVKGTLKRKKERDELDTRICIAMQLYQEYWDLMQTIPGLDVWSSVALIAPLMAFRLHYL